jgi:DNA-binding Xre family transcriptional regulator
MLAKKIKKIMVDREMTLTQMAGKIGNTSVQNLSQKLKRDNLNEKELIEIADALGCELVIEFKDKTTGEIL